MNILLVDDDSYVLEVLKKSINWESIGIKNVYSAPSVRRAIKIFEDIPIQILICDIEMPKESGFELIKWIQEKKYIVKEILLTSYAEFSYASEAIKYGCHAYVLKPVDFNEMEKMITDAIAAEKKALSIVNHAKYYAYWSESAKYRKTEYFQRLLFSDNKPDLIQYDLQFKGNDLFFPCVIINYSNIDNIADVYEKSMLEWTVGNIFTDTFAGASYSVEAVLRVEKEIFLTIIKLDNNSFDAGFAQQAAKIFLKKVNQNIGENFSVVIGKVADLHMLKEEISPFLEYIKNALFEYGQIEILEDYSIKEKNYQEPNYELWEHFLADGQAETLKKEVDKYLDIQAGQRRLDRRRMRKLILSFIQMLVSLLKAKNINSYQQENHLFSLEQINYSIQNVTNAKKVIHEMIDTIMNITLNGQDGLTIIDMVMAYINQNLEQEISREVLAKYVFLNPDYLARVFKKETGKSIGNYITHQRIEMAKEYLVKTEESVNSIAIRVGYDNFSYFTKVFKEKVGVTPKEYRHSAGMVFSKNSGTEEIS